MVILALSNFYQGANCKAVRMLYNREVLPLVGCLLDGVHDESSSSTSPRQVLNH